MTAVNLSNWGDEPPLFIRLLATEVRATDRGKAAARIGMSRTAVSLILANKYPSPSTGGVERRVMNVLGRIDCPAVSETVTVEQCQSYRDRPPPTHNPQAMQHWRACQHCPLNPNCKGDGYATVH
ncbi:hypothetical protein ACIOZM_15215 [Pseudomonas sp. NPDC087346]|uniref:hypothetical protein n=1 Tax=Pseudomonas sp. NPDC087346 TaxID=3364438 RepID=UPI0037FA1950